jgi:hypothetical protein
MNLSRASKEFVMIYCIASGRSPRYASYYRKLLRRFIAANGNQDVAELSRSHIQFYLAMELGHTENGSLRPVRELRRECDLLLDFYKWLAAQGFIEPLHPLQSRSSFRRQKNAGIFLN